MVALTETVAADVGCSDSTFGWDAMSSDSSRKKQARVNTKQPPVTLHPFSPTDCRRPRRRQVRVVVAGCAGVRRCSLGLQADGSSLEPKVGGNGQTHGIIVGRNGGWKVDAFTHVGISLVRSILTRGGTAHRC